jgi:hypothetical protein
VELALAFDAFTDFRLVDEILPDRLDGDLAGQLRVLREVHVAHPAGT